jgi:hypothetical protein
MAPVVLTGTAKIRSSKTTKIKPINKESRPGTAFFVYYVKKRFTLFASFDGRSIGSGSRLIRG